MKKLVFAWLLALAGMAHAQAAGPYVYATEAAAIDTATLSVNGAGAIACDLGTFPASTGSNIRCPLTSLTVPGVYTLAIKVVQNPGTTVTGSNSATTNPGGSAVSAPFAWTLNSAVVGTPGQLKVGS